MKADIIDGVERALAVITERERREDDPRRGFGTAVSGKFAEGAMAAAAVADTYNASSSHRYRLGDCILGKLNIRPGEPRKNRHATNEWARGYAVALAEMNRRLDCPTVIAEALRSAGLTASVLKRLRLDDYDMQQLRKCLPKKGAK